MTENIPPSASKPPVNSDRPGLPYYEKLRRDLRDTLQKKRLLDRNLGTLEDQIWSQETVYLEESSAAGNIVKGFDQYIKASAVTGAASAGTISGSQLGGMGRRKAAVNDTDRVFSRSSVTYRDSDSPSSATSTPGHAPTPTGSFTAEKTGDKKKKKSTVGTNDDDTDTKNEGRPTKRQKITFGSGRKSIHED